MNQSAEKHLSKAKTYLGKGEAWYRKAAEEIAEAMVSDPTLTYPAIGESLGYSRTWVGTLVRWHNEGGITPTPRTRSVVAEETRTTKRILRDAPMESVEKLISDLPPKRQRQIAAAAGDPKAKKLEEMAEAVERSDFDFDKATDLGFWPNINAEARHLIAKLAEIQVWLDKHGDEMIPEPSGETDPEPARDIMRDGLASRKAEIDTAFANVGVGTSIEEGMNRLLRDN